MYLTHIINKLTIIMIRLNSKTFVFEFLKKNYHQFFTKRPLVYNDYNVYKILINQNYKSNVRITDKSF